MGFLIAGVVLVGALCVLDLLLTVAVLRRLRGHEAALSSLRPGANLDALVGTRIPEFELTTVEGRTLTEADLHGRTWVLAFLSTTCAPCREQVPELRRVADGGDRVVVVVTGDPAAGNGIVEGLQAAVGTVTTTDGLGTEIGVSSYPTLLAVDPDGVVAAAAHHVAGLAPQA